MNTVYKRTFNDNCELKGMLVDGALLHCIQQGGVKCRRHMYCSQGAILEEGGLEKKEKKVCFSMVFQFCLGFILNNCFFVTLLQHDNNKIADINPLDWKNPQKRGIRYFDSSVHFSTYMFNYIFASFAIRIGNEKYTKTEFG